MAARVLRLGQQLNKIGKFTLNAGVLKRNGTVVDRQFLCLTNGTNLLSAQASPAGDSIRCYCNQSTKASQKLEYKDQHAELGAFENFDITEATQNKLKVMGINYLFPVQHRTFNQTINGIDVVVHARTGTGKTLSFALPLVEKLQRHRERLREHGRSPLVVVLAPTRELAYQVQQDFSKISTQVKVACVFGGQSYQLQVPVIQKGIDVIVGTPGRMQDLIEQGILSLGSVEHVILDEVDQMLDMGFADKVEEIISSIYRRANRPQTMMYSATMPTWVRKTASKYLSRDHEVIDLVGKESEQTATTIKQYAIRCRQIEHDTLIKDLVKIYSDGGLVIVFCRTKVEVDALCRRHGDDARALHGGIAQNSRNIILQGFKNQTFNILVATDVAARGLDIPDVSLIIQTSPPQDSSSYIHRVGRTGRAGKSGMSILLYSSNEEHDVDSCQKAAKTKFEELPKPTIDQLYKSWTEEAVRHLNKVPSGISSHFTFAAEQLIKQKGPIDALSDALAVISGAIKYVNRSLITMKPGQTTLCYKSDSPMSLSEARSRLHDYLSAQNVSPKSVQLTQDATGAVFDIPDETVAFMLREFDNLKKEEAETLEKIIYLPPLEEQGHRGMGYSGSYGNNRSGGYNNRQNRNDRSSYNRNDRSSYNRNDRSSYNRNDRSNYNRGDRSNYNRSDGSNYNRNDDSYRQRSKRFDIDEYF